MRSSWRSIAVMSVAACAFLTPLAASLDAALAQQKKPSHRTQRQGMFALSQMESAPVVMLGDSLTEAPPWAEITGCAFVANRGIGGDDTAGLLKRLDGVTTLQPTAVFLMIGVNDVASSVATETIVENADEILDKLKKAGARVYLTLVLPVAESFTKKINPKIDELNRAYVKLAKEKQVQVVDFRAEMRNADGFLKDEFSRDGIHLTADGYRVWRDAVMPLVLQHCGPKPFVPQLSAPKPGRITTTPAANTPAANVPAANGPAPSGTLAPASEFNMRFGPWR